MARRAARISYSDMHLEWWCDFSTTSIVREVSMSHVERIVFRRFTVRHNRGQRGSDGRADGGTPATGPHPEADPDGGRDLGGPGRGAPRARHLARQALPPGGRRA